MCPAQARVHARPQSPPRDWDSQMALNDAAEANTTLDVIDRDAIVRARLGTEAVFTWRADSQTPGRSLPP